MTMIGETCSLIFDMTYRSTWKAVNDCGAQEWLDGFSIAVRRTIDPAIKDPVQDGIMRTDFGEGDD
jgi:hypothetical protein